MALMWLWFVVGSIFPCAKSWRCALVNRHFILGMLNAVQNDFNFKYGGSIEKAKFAGAY
jgi:hypothetical protein